MAEDSRFNMGLISDVFNVLDAHGYTRGERAVVDAVIALARLTAEYEGADAATPDGGGQ